MLLGEPGALILLSAVVGFIGTVIFIFALLAIHLRLLPRLVPLQAAPGRTANFLLGTSGFFYFLLAIAYGLALR